MDVQSKNNMWDLTGWVSYIKYGILGVACLIVLIIILTIILKFWAASGRGFLKLIPLKWRRKKVEEPETLIPMIQPNSLANRTNAPLNIAHDHTDTLFVNGKLYWKNVSHTTPRTVKCNLLTPPTQQGCVQEQLTAIETPVGNNQANSNFCYPNPYSFYSTNWTKRLKALKLECCLNAWRNNCYFQKRNITTSENYIWWTLMFQNLNLTIEFVLDGNIFLQLKTHVSPAQMRLVDLNILGQT